MAIMEGLNGLSAVNGLVRETDPFATPEQRSGGPAHPHSEEYKSQPYSYISIQTPAGSHGPYGPENELLSDAEYWFIESAGTPSQDPMFDEVMPNITKSHGAPKHVTISGPVGSQFDSINYQVGQSVVTHSGDVNASKQMLLDMQGFAQQDQWQEVWNVTPGHDDVPQNVPGAISNQSAGFGSNDHTSNAYAKRNEYELDSAHFHRRFATGSIPGNYMWLKPSGRPLHKTMAGPARPAIGTDSPFEGDDLGMAFGIQGAILQNVPQEYNPPPTPTYNPSVMVAPNPFGTDPIDMW